MAVTFIHDFRRMTTNVIRFWRDENNARKSTLICRIQPIQRERLYSAPKRVATRDEGEDAAEVYVATELCYVCYRVLFRRYNIVYSTPHGDKVFWGTESDSSGLTWRKEQGLTDDDIRKIQAECKRLDSLWEQTLAKVLCNGFGSEYDKHNVDELIARLRQLQLSHTDNTGQSLDIN